MALDGITISNLAYELKTLALGGRIDKIAQPEKDEIILNIRSLGSNYKLLMTANPSHPRLHFTMEIKTNPLQAPLFCMVLRKHLTGGKLTAIRQPDFERILELDIESLNELGDWAVKTLLIEIMGKHSNIILLDENGIILDSIKHVSHETSSVREVLPGKHYTRPPSGNKKNPLLLERNDFYRLLDEKKQQQLQAVLYQSYNGISPVMASEICCRAGADPSGIAELETPEVLNRLFESFEAVMTQVKQEVYQPRIYFDEDEKPFEFSCLPFSLFAGCRYRDCDNVSQLLEIFYRSKDGQYRIKQKTADLRKLVSQGLERCVKKKELYLKTLREIQDRDRLKTYGELLTAHIHSLRKGMTTFTTEDFYQEDLPQVTIPLDSQLTPSENAQRYFKKYNKEKRTFTALQEQMKQNEEELAYLDSVLTALSVSGEESDIEEIRQELYEQGFLHKRRTGRQKTNKPREAKPLRYVSSDGFHIYVGKNNKQNDRLTFQLASATDLWFHTKEIPGSHVIVKTDGNTVPDTTLLEAANLAAYYSKGRQGSQVPVDYTLRKNVKKPAGAKPGFVIYEKNNTLYMKPDEELIKSLKQS